MSLLCAGGCVSVEIIEAPTDTDASGGGGAGPDGGNGGTGGGQAGSGGTTSAWAHTLASPEHDHGIRVQADGVDQLVFAGRFSGTVDFAGQLFTSQGKHDLLAAKLDRSGTFLWGRVVGGPETEHESQGAVDAEGYVLLAGDYAGTVTVEAGVELVSQGETDLLFVRFAPDGSLSWAKSFGGSGMDYAPVIAFDAQGDVLFAAAFEGTVDFGGGPLTASNSRDVVVAKLDGDTGSHLWSKAAGGGADEGAHGIAVNAAGDLAVAGWFGNSIDFGGGPLTPGGGYVAKLSGTDGAHLWSKALSNGQNNGGCGVSFDGADDLLLTGWFQGALDFGGGPIVSNDHSDAFVAKYAGATGAHVWSSGFGGPGVDSSCAVIAVANDALVMGGFFAQSIDFGGGPLTSPTPVPDAYLAALSADGSHLWSHSFGNSSADYVHGLASYPNGDLLVAGEFGGQVDLFGIQLTEAGSNDGFVAHLPAGLLQP